MSTETPESPPLGDIGTFRRDLNEDTGPGPAASAVVSDGPAGEALTVSPEGRARPPQRPRSATPDDASRPVGKQASRELERRDVEPSEVAERLRGMLGLMPEQLADGEAAASLRRDLPTLVQGLDAGGWIAWCLVGLVIFGERFPALETIRQESKRVAAALAMLRAKGNISAAAMMLKTSRKVLRENLRVAGLYPWRVMPTEGTAARAHRTAERFAAWLDVVGPVLDLARAHLREGATRSEAIERALREHPVSPEIARASRAAWSSVAARHQGGSP